MSGSRPQTSLAGGSGHGKGRGALAAEPGQRPDDAGGRSAGAARPRHGPSCFPTPAARAAISQGENSNTSISRGAFHVGAAPPTELQKRRRPGSATPGHGTPNAPEGRRNRGEQKRYFSCLENVAYRLTVESAARVFKGCILKPPLAPHTSPRCPLRPRGERGPPGGVSPAWSHRSPARPRLPAHRGADGGLSFPVAVPAGGTLGSEDELRAPGPISCVTTGNSGGPSGPQGACPTRDRSA